MANKFSERVYSLVKQVPYGKVTTYKEIAKALDTKAYRAVGNALNKNPNPDKVKCCKVVKSDGNIGGFSRGVKEKIKRLKKEEIEAKDGRILDFDRKVFRFSKKQA